MHRSKHTQRPFVWEAPPISPDAGDPFGKGAAVASATECTGLEARPLQNKQQAENAAALLNIHKQKPQGNIGKGNPNNDKGEIDFHRST